jgi:GT2 family glycosyltransferase
MAGFDFTLILCTCGRTAEVAEFFSALDRDTDRDLTLQIFVVDQNEDDRLSPVVERYKTRWTVEHVRSRIKGISLARNLVLDRIDGEFVAFPDDDCIYLDGALRKVGSFFAAHPKTDVVMGCWGDIAGPTFPPRFEKKVGRFSLFKHGEAFVQFYRRRVIEAVGAFDTDFGPGPQSKYPCGGDDSDYLLRAALAGFEIRRVSEIHIAHPMQNVEGFSADKIVGYGVTRMKLLKKHRMPLWFELANVLYPLLQMLRHPGAAKYFAAMLRGRLKGMR